MQHILVKAAPGFSASQLTFGASAVTFATTRLFQSIDFAAGAWRGRRRGLAHPDAAARICRGKRLGRLSFADAAGTWRRRQPRAHIRRA